MIDVLSPNLLSYSSLCGMVATGRVVLVTIITLIAIIVSVLLIVFYLDQMWIVNKTMDIII